MSIDLKQFSNGDIKLPSREGMVGCKVTKDEVEAISEHHLMKFGWWLDEKTGCLVGTEPNPAGEYLVLDSMRIVLTTTASVEEVATVYNRALHSFLLKYPRAVLDSE